MLRQEGLCPAYALESAIQFCTVCFSARGPLNASRTATCRHRVGDTREERVAGLVAQMLLGGVDVSLHDLGGEPPDLLLLGRGTEVDRCAQRPVCEQREQPNR